MSDEIALFHLWVDSHEQEIIEALQGAVRIPSKKEEPAGPGAPYGQPIRAAFDYTLDLSPACSFPLIYAEKGIANLILEKTVPETDARLRIASAAGGLRPNMVPEHAEARITGSPEALFRAMATLQKHWDRNLTAEAGEECIHVRAGG